MLQFSRFSADILDEMHNKIIAHRLTHTVRINASATSDWINNILTESKKAGFSSAIMASQVGATYDSVTGITRIACYSPVRGRNPQVLRLWIPTRDGSFRKEELPMNIHDKKPFHYVAVTGITPMRGDRLGALYQIVDSVTGEDVADPNAEFLPAGAAGKVAAIIDHDFAWGRKEHEWLVSGAKDPYHVLKVHIGAASPEGTFKGLADALDHDGRFQDIDTLELLPISDYTGIARNTVLIKNGSLTLSGNNEALGGWGYDTQGFYGSVSSMYGTPDDLKSLVRKAHEKDIKVSIDLQLNHLGPSGVTADHFFNIAHPTESTPWGAPLDYQNTFVRA